MKRGITHIDHPVIAVRDMDAARATYERLGFIVPPRGSHPAWGTGNWCIQFAEDYLELRGIIEPQRAAREAHGLSAFLARREGLMGVAFETGNAQASHDALVAAGLHPRPVKPLTRDFELPGGVVPVAFNLCFLEPAEVPGLMHVVLCEHVTPERLRRPEWLRHPNGATRVRGMTGIVADVGSVVGAHAKVFETVRRREHDVTLVLRDDGWIALTTPAEFARRYPALRFEPALAAPALGVITLETSSLAETRAVLQQHGVSVQPNGGGLLVQPAEACGAALEFVER